MSARVVAVLPLVLIGLVGCQSGSKKDATPASPTSQPSTSAPTAFGTDPCSWVALGDAIRYSGASAGATCRLRHEGHHEAYVGDKDHTLDWYIVSPGERWNLNDDLIVVTAANAGQILDGTRRQEAGPEFVIKGLDALGPSAWEETEGHADGPTTVFCIGRSGGIVVVRLHNASLGSDEQIADAVKVAKGLQQVSA